MTFKEYCQGIGQKMTAVIGAHLLVILVFFVVNNFFSDNLTMITDKEITDNIKVAKLINAENTYVGEVSDGTITFHKGFKDTSGYQLGIETTDGKKTLAPDPTTLTPSYYLGFRLNKYVSLAQNANGDFITYESSDFLHTKQKVNTLLVTLILNIGLMLYDFLRVKALVKKEPLTVQLTIVGAMDISRLRIIDDTTHTYTTLDYAAIRQKNRLPQNRNQGKQTPYIIQLTTARMPKKHQWRLLLTFTNGDRSSYAIDLPTEESYRSFKLDNYKNSMIVGDGLTDGFQTIHPYYTKTK